MTVLKKIIGIVLVLPFAYFMYLLIRSNLEACIIAIVFVCFVVLFFKGIILIMED